MTAALLGYLTVLFLAMVFVMATIASFYLNRLRNQPTTPFSEEIGSAKSVVAKVRKREPMTQDELAYARRIVANRSSLAGFAIPGMIFMLGCFYVFGSLQHLHGATPSERTFLGVIPMLTSINLAIRMLSSARLKRRLRKMA
jgi:K+-transporting ATPase A subunit